ncbi:MAG TPA: UDP-N-acetylglucosamine--N-acetylmuramyl-(pentapeptide) pyrophosphoryl-undecaprenol N-acetylglucosamine transferase [Candidatus Paceibacterota bacterium]|nr:UDP-N-acetylglucosamine--N-acetylmuramyl-(pentapeptide) pyrophosphoryl-undecaprenol N-acetylglucosamine transferase [Candidatus Paceibacterota bacterium]
MAFRILLVGGGSGGHVYPLIAVARALQEQAKAQNRKVTVKLMGDGPFVARAAKEAGFKYTSIIAPKLRRYASAGNVLDVFKIPLALLQSLWKLFWFMPNAVFAKGGYTCAFPTLAARFYMIPVFLHESDSVPGLANRLLAKRSQLVFTSFMAADEMFRGMGLPTMLVGNPFRKELCCVERSAAHAALNLDPVKRTVFIIGGSQGAKQLNDIVINGLVQMVAQKDWNVIHQCGDRNFDDVQKAVKQFMEEGKDSYAANLAAQYRVYPFLGEQELAAAYGACDVAITRASASALTELAYAGKPMVVVPLLGSANNHQQENAAEMMRYGAAVVDGANATVGLVMAQVERFMDPAAATDATDRIKAFVHPDAADRIAQTLLKG